MSNFGITERIEEINERISKAAASAGRDPSTVKVLGATKAQPVDKIREAYDAGLKLFGENRMQELLDKQPKLPSDAEWHFIGGLQRKKVSKVLPLVTMIQSLDSFILAEEINNKASGAGRTMPCLVQVNLDREATKGGIDPDELLPFVESLQKFSSIEIAGLMAIPAPVDEEGILRKSFQCLRALCEKIKEQIVPSCKELSMGMSRDFLIAVEEGATIVRLGESLFGERT